MPKLTSRPPLYKQSGKYAVIYVNGKRVFLGLYGSPESHVAYARFLAEWQANPTFYLAKEERNITVRELAAAFLDHAIITQAEHKPKGSHGVPVGYIGTAGVQALLNKSRGTIWRMILDGRLPRPLRDGKMNIWDRKEILRWIDNAKFCKKR